MSKGKYKRKRQHPQRHTQQQLAQIKPLDGKAIPAKEQEKSSATGEAEGNNKKEDSMGFRELAKRSSLTDWCLTVFTFVLATAAIYQFSIMGSQLEVMRKDQRPWIGISFDVVPLQPNAPISSTINIVNKGKTPAREIRGDMAIERVRNGEQPQLNYPLPHAALTTGSLFPGDTRSSPFSKQRSSNNSGALEPDLLTQPDFDDFNNGRLFFVIYANVSYKDFFGIQHWTRLCMVYVPSNVEGTFSGQKCTNYGDVDSN